MNTSSLNLADTSGYENLLDSNAVSLHEQARNSSQATSIKLMEILRFDGGPMEIRRNTEFDKRTAVVKDKQDLKSEDGLTTIEEEK